MISRRQREQLLSGLLILLALLAAYLLRHTEDDAFITFRYSRHVAEGFGPVWNTGGEAIEGYTNFLWMLLMVVPHLLGLEVVGFAEVLSLLFLGAGFWLWRGLIWLFLQDAWLRWSTLLLVVFNYTLLCYGTSGLETALNGFLLVAFLTYGVRLEQREIRLGFGRWLDAGPGALPGRKDWQGGNSRAGKPKVLRPGRSKGDFEERVVENEEQLGLSISSQRWRLFVWGIIGALCILSRHDNVLVLACWLGLGIWGLVAGNSSSGSRKSILRRPVYWSLLPLFLIVLCFLGWRWSFYGELLPNTFYAKGASNFKEGAYYVLAFLVVYGFILLPLVMLVQWRRRWWLVRSGWWAWMAPVLAWMGYLVLIGGDYMEFRMWVPVLPILILGLGKALEVLVPRRETAMAVLLVCGALNLEHGYGHGHFYQLRFITPVHPPLSEGAPPYLSLIDQALGLDDLFGDLEGGLLRFATGNCGAYAYFNDGFDWVDIYGLNDAWIARNGLRRDFGPGHRVVSPFQHLLDREVNLVSVACYHRSVLKKNRIYSASDQAFDAVLGGYVPVAGTTAVQVLEVPLQEDFVLLCLYLHPHPSIEAQLEIGHFPPLQKLNFP